MEVRTIYLRFLSKDARDQFISSKLPNISELLYDTITKLEVSKNGVSFRVGKSNVVKLKSNENTYWVGMPTLEIDDENITFATIEVSFIDIGLSGQEDFFGQVVSDSTQYLYHPRREKSFGIRELRIVSNRGNPKYPVYIISKGRARVCKTADLFIKMEMPFKIIVEKSDYQNYADVYGEDVLLTLDEQFKVDYNTFIKEEDPKNKVTGSGPARNFAWWHSIQSGADWHWIVDDNILEFEYFLDGKKRICAVDGSIFAHAEDFVDRFTNITIAGLQYRMFAVPGDDYKQYRFNHRAFSCILIKNDLPFRWEGRYNEDVELYLKNMKEGFASVLLYAFLQDKMTTQTLSGGNTTEFYQSVGTLPKALMTRDNHPDVTKVLWKLKRWHHLLDIRQFTDNATRTVDSIINTLNTEQIIQETDIKIINHVKNLNLNDAIDPYSFDFIKSENVKKRVLDVVMFYKYKKDNEYIINRLLRPRVINCFLHNVDDLSNQDSRIVKDILSLTNESGVIQYAFDESIFDYIDPVRKQYIIEEIKRNNPLPIKPENFEEIDFNLQMVRITKQDHDIRRDSKLYIEDRYINNLELPRETITLTDKYKRKLEIPPKNSHNKKTVERGNDVYRIDQEKTTFIHGTPDFTNERLFNTKIPLLLSDTKNIVNLVNEEVSVYSAIYALTHKLKSLDVVPDTHQYGRYSGYIKAYDKIVDVIDDCVIFVKEKMTDDILYLVNLLKAKNIKHTIIYDTNSNTLF